MIGRPRKNAFRLAAAGATATWMALTAAAAEEPGHRTGAFAEALAEQQRRLGEQERRLAEQARLIEEQRRVLEEQRREFEALRAALADAAKRAEPPRRSTAAGTGRPPVPALKPAAPDPARAFAALDSPAQLATVLAAVQGRGGPATGGRPVAVAQADPAPPPTVGQDQHAPAPPEERRPEIAALSEAGGVLTPRGMLVVEPSLDYSHASVNRFVFQGVEILEAVLVGGIEATDSDRNTLTAATTFRYGITNRLEVDAKVPFVYRTDRLRNLILGDDGGGMMIRDLDGTGLGDIEFGAHYQLTARSPYLVGNLRVKTPTGKGPFDVDRTSQGLESELATGSGFWGIEPSVTAIYPTDPVVFFGNIGYLWNIRRDVNERIGDAVIERVDPGDSISTSVGMGVSLNERTSFSLGYRHDYVFKTDTSIRNDDGVRLAAETEGLQVGSAFFGASYRISERVSVSANFQIGATSDAPDVQVTLRIPIAFDLGGPQRRF